jgi:hypothetical protein
MCAPRCCRLLRFAASTALPSRAAPTLLLWMESTAGHGYYVRSEKCSVVDREDLSGGRTLPPRTRQRGASQFGATADLRPFSSGE